MRRDQSWARRYKRRSKAGSHREILGLGVVQYDRRGRLLRVELKALAEGEPDAIGAEQVEDLFLVLQVRTGGIAEGIARAAIALLQKPVAVARGQNRSASIGKNSPAAPNVYAYRMSSSTFGTRYAIATARTPRTIVATRAARTSSASSAAGRRRLR